MRESIDLLPLAFGVCVGTIVSLLLLFFFREFSPQGREEERKGEEEEFSGRQGWVRSRLKDYGIEMSASDVGVLFFVLCVIIFILLFSLVRVFWVSLLFSPILGAFLSWFFLVSGGERRQEALTNQLMTFFDNYHARLSGGTSHRQAFIEVYRSMKHLRPLGEVLEVTYLGVMGGKSFAEALAEADEREGRANPTLHYFAEAMMVQAKTGGEIENVISSVKETLYSQHLLKQQLKTKVVNQIWVARFMSAIVPFSFLLLFLLRRDLATSFFSDILGILALVFSAFLVLGGIYLINRLILNVRRLI